MASPKVWRVAPAMPWQLLMAWYQVLSGLYHTMCTTGVGTGVGVGTGEGEGVTVEPGSGALHTGQRFLPASVA